MSSFAIPKGGLFDFVPSPQPRKAKSVSNRRAAARKAQQEAVKRARTPNANAISPKPNPLKPVGGAGILGIAAKAAFIFAIVEGLFPRPTARSALDEIDDPALLYPPSSEVIEETLLPSRTEQGFGDVPGIRYEIYWEWDNDVEREEEPYEVKRDWFITDPYYRSPFVINEIRYYGAYETYVGFPEVTGIGRGGRWEVFGTARDQSDNEVPFSQQALGQGGIFTRARGKFLNMRPQGGQPSPPIVEVNQTTATAIPVIPIDNEFFQRDSYIAYERLSKGRYKPRPAPRFPNPPKPEQILDPDPVTADGRVAQATPTPVENPAQTTNQKNELDPQATTPTDIAKAPTQQKAPIQEATKEQIKEPTKTVEWRSTGTGSSAVKVTTETTADGTKTETIETSTGQVVSIKRTRLTNLRISDISTAQDTPIANNDTATFDNQIGGQGEDLLLDDPVIGTPDPSGIGIKTIPEPEAFKQTPTPDPDDLGNDDLAKIAALIAATSLTAEGLKSSVEDAVCDSLDSGCMKSKLKDPLDGRLDGLNTALQGLDLSLLTTINNKLGDALPEGLSGFLTKAWASIRVNKVLDYINTALLLHNATLLSTNIAASLGDILSMIANNTINLIKNEDGSNLDINATIGGTIEQFLINTLGAENYQNASQTFHRTSRIVNAAANIMNTINFSLAGMAEGLETVGNYTGKIGNSLKKAGAVFENSYQWMSENLTVKTGKIGQVQAVLDGLEQVENVASDLENATSEFREVQENVTQIGSEFNKIKTEVNAQETAKTQLETTTKTNSQGAQPSASDYTPDPIG